MDICWILLIFSLIFGWTKFVGFFFPDFKKVYRSNNNIDQKNEALKVILSDKSFFPSWLWNMLKITNEYKTLPEFCELAAFDVCVDMCTVVSSDVILKKKKFSFTRVS